MLLLLSACAEAPPALVAGSPVAAPSASPTAVPTAPPATPTPTLIPTRPIVTPLAPTATPAAPPPVVPLADDKVVDRWLRGVRAVTDGTRKYLSASWGPGTTLVALVPQDGPGLDLVDVVTGAVTSLVTDTYVLEPRWTGDGRLLLHRTSGGMDSLTLYDPIARTMSEPLVSGPPLSAPSASGSLLTFAQDRQVRLCRERCDATPAAVAPGGALVTALTPPGVEPEMLAWTPEVVNLEEVQTLVAEVADRDELALVRPRPLSVRGEGLWLPRWSPDGTHVALTGIGGRLVVAAADGSSRIDLGPGDAPAWSPDGERIAYAGASAGLEYITRDIHIVPADGAGDRVRVTDAGEEELYVSPSWSPNGRQLAFVEIDSGRLFVGDVP